MTTISAPCISSRTLRECLDNESPASIVSSLFSSAPLLPLRIPSLWPHCTRLPEGQQPITHVRITWCGIEGLLVLFAIGEPFRSARDDPSNKMSILNDSRVEIFIASTDEQMKKEPEKQISTSAVLRKYTCYEMNTSGRTLDFTVMVPKQFDYSWDGNAQLLARWEEKQKISKETEQCNTTTYMLIMLPWTDFCSPELVQRIIHLSVPSPDSVALKDATPIQFYIGLYRGEAISRGDGKEDEMVWQSWIDPLSPRVDFHVPETFGILTLNPPTTPIPSSASVDTESFLLSDDVAAAESLSDVSLITAPGLYQGSLSSLSLRTFRSYGITRVLNAAAGSVRAPAECYSEESGVQQFSLYLEDDLYEDLFNPNAERKVIQSSAASASVHENAVRTQGGGNIVDAAQWIDQCLNEGHRVLVHCAQGKSRSGAVVLFYLMRSRRLSFSRAFALLKAARPTAQPNSAFITQLQRWSRAEELEEEEQVDDDDAPPMPPAAHTWKQQRD
jgi:protein-tyrosine phosphatase